MTPAKHQQFPFVLLYHELPPGQAVAPGRGAHWDLMVATDDDGLLRTWALEEAPSFGQDEAFSIAALSLPDHRRAYLEYEGPVSGDRGTVVRQQAGLAEWEGDSKGKERVCLILGDRVWQASFCNETQRMEFSLRS